MQERMKISMFYAFLLQYAFCSQYCILCIPFAVCLLQPIPQSSLWLPLWLRFYIHMLLMYTNTRSSRVATLL